MEAADRARTGRTADRDLTLVLIAALAIGGALLTGIIAGDAPMLAVAAAGTALLGTMIILRPDVAILTCLAILYSNAAVIAVRFHDVPFFVGAAVPLLLVVPLARDLIVRRLPVVAPPTMPWMVALLFIHLVSSLFSDNQVRSWDETVLFAIEGFGLYFLLINVIRTPELLRQATWVLLAAGAIVALLSVHQDLTNNYDSNYWGFAQPSDAEFRTGGETLTGELTQRRLAGSIGETNRFAQVLLMLVPLGIFRFMAEPSRMVRWIAAAMTVVITLGVVLTFSRGAAVGLGVLLVALAVLRLVQPRHLVAIAVALVLVFVAFPQYWLRVSSLAEVGALVNDESGTGDVGGAILSRTTELLAAGLVMVDHPVIGVGPNMFPEHYQQYADLVGIRVIEGATRESHNLYLGLGAELGIVGLGVFLIIAFLTLRMLLTARRRSLVRRPDLERLTTPFFLALLTYYATGMFLHLSFARFYWLMLAVAGAAAVITLAEMTAMDEDEAAAAARAGQVP